MLLQKGVNFLLIPILTLFLTTKDYGIVAVIMAVNAFLNVFYLLGLDGSLNRFYYEYKNDNLFLKKLFGTVITFVFCNSFIISLILFFCRKWLLVPFLADVEFYPYMGLGLISVIFNPCFTIYQNSLQARQEGVKYGKNNLMFFLVNITLLLLSVIVFGMGAEGVLGALAITNITFFIYTLFQFKRDLTFGIDYTILKKVLKYSAPLIPHNISGVTTNMIDRILINKLLSTSMVGIYSVGNNFGNIVFLVVSGIGQAFTPWFNERVKKNEIHEVSSISKLLLIIFCVIALCLSFFGEEVIYLITPIAYHESWRVIPLIAFAFVFHGVYYFFAAPLFYDIEGKGNRIIPLVTILTALTNIGLNYIFIPLYGIVGAALATLISKFILALSLSFVYKKFVNIEYPLIFLLLTPITFLSISLISFIEMENALYFFMIKSLFVLFVVELLLHLNY